MNFIWVQILRFRPIWTEDRDFTDELTIAKMIRILQLLLIFAVHLRTILETFGSSNPCYRN